MHRFTSEEGEEEALLFEIRYRSLGAALHDFLFWEELNGACKFGSAIVGHAAVIVQAPPTENFSFFPLRLNIKTAEK